MKLIITLRVQYPDKEKTETNKYNTEHIEDRYEQTVEVENELQASVVVAKVIKAFNGFEP